MADEQLLNYFMNSLKSPYLFADCEHVIRYMNEPAIRHYDKGAELLGTSLFDCHNEQSNKVILEVFERMKAGLDEELITDNKKWRIYMRAVRDGRGTLLGYYERYDPPREG